MCYHRPALKPLPPGLYTKLLALKDSRYLYYKISLFMSNFAKGNNRKNKTTFKKKKKNFIRLSTHYPLSAIQVCSKLLAV